MKLNKTIVFSSNAANISGLCSGANLLADETIALVLGTRAEAEAITSYANRVLWLGEIANGAMAESYTGEIEAIAKNEAAVLVMTSGSMRDRCIAAKLAVRLNAGVITDTAALAVNEEAAVEGRRNVYGGAAEAVIKGTASTTIAVVPAGVFEDLKAAEPGTFTEISAAPEDTGIKLLSVSAKQEESVDIAVAKRVVGVGRGIGSEENMQAAQALAAKLGAELGCTRPIAEEEHWMARNRYIGVSGVTVRPDVYIALGISGQVQHMVGANDSKLIVAINKDPKALIFENCDIGLVADMNKILPALTEKL